MHLIDVFNSIRTSIPFLVNRHRLYFRDALTGENIFRPAFIFQEFSQRIYVVCEFSQGTWFWVLHGHLDLHVPLYCENVLHCCDGTMPKEQLEKCLSDFMRRLVEGEYKSMHYYVNTSEPAFLYWEYLRLYMCIKYKLEKPRTVAKIDLIRKCNKRVGLLTDNDIENIEYL